MPHSEGPAAAPITERHPGLHHQELPCAPPVLRHRVSRTAEAITIPYAHTPQRQPEILPREELARLFEAAANLRTRTLLMTAYAAGPRVSEVCTLRVADIDSAPDRSVHPVVEVRRVIDTLLQSEPARSAARSIGASANPAYWLFLAPPTPPSRSTSAVQQRV